MKQVGNTILAKGVNHILAKRDNSAWPKGAKLSGFSSAKVTFNLKGHYNTSCFIERNGKFVYISHSSGLSRMGSGVKIELDSFLIRTAQHAKDYRGGHNQYCDITNLQSMIDNLLE